MPPAAKKHKKPVVRRKAELKDFKVGKQLACGSFGCTYVARDKRNDQTVVMKRTNKNPDPDDPDMEVTDREDWQNEVDILQYLRQFCDDFVVCATEDAFEDKNFFYIITRYLGGYVTLRDWRSESWEEDLPYLTCQLIQALQYLHAAGVAHRDIKLDNILVEPKTLSVKFIDFGLSCRLGQCSYARLGTDYYMAPEIWFETPGLQYNFLDWTKADIWSLGMTLFRLAANFTYFEALRQEARKGPRQKRSAQSRVAGENGIPARPPKTTPSGRIFARGI